VGAVLTCRRIRAVYLSRCNAHSQAENFSYSSTPSIEQPTTTPLVGRTSSPHRRLDAAAEHRSPRWRSRLDRGTTARRVNRICSADGRVLRLSAQRRRLEALPWRSNERSADQSALTGDRPHERVSAPKTPTYMKSSSETSGGGGRESNQKSQVWVHLRLLAWHLMSHTEQAFRRKGASTVG